MPIRHIYLHCLFNYFNERFQETSSVGVGSINYPQLMLNVFYNTDRASPFYHETCEKMIVVISAAVGEYENRKDKLSSQERNEYQELRRELFSLMVQSANSAYQSQINKMFATFSGEKTDKGIEINGPDILCSPQTLLMLADKINVLKLKLEELQKDNSVTKEHSQMDSATSKLGTFAQASHHINPLTGPQSRSHKK